MSSTIHDLADRHLPGDDYTVERREFTDGDTRTLARYSVGWSSTNYRQYTLWQDLGEIWVEYYEHDVRRDRRRFRFELGERVI
jgi:hypothetical protein